jgi:nucleoside-diphosphate-sugar epimerase
LDNKNCGNVGKPLENNNQSGEYVKRVIVTGATGFTGEQVVRQLIKENYQVTCFVRKTSNLSRLEKLPVILCYGDLSDVDSMLAAFSGNDYLINTASIGFGHAQNIVAAAEQLCFKHCVFFSTTAIFTSLSAQTKSIRLKAEESIIQSSLNYTIVRPTMIYGSRRDRNMVKLIKCVRWLPIIPIFGSGTYLQQPVFVVDLAKAVTAIFGTDKTLGKAYNLSGKKPLSYNEIIDIVAETLNRRILKLHIPLKLSLSLVRLLYVSGIFKKISVEQILRLNENKDFSHAEATLDFGYSPVDFREGIRKECFGMRNVD